MPKPFEKFDKKLDDKEKKQYLEHSQKVSAKHKEYNDVEERLKESMKTENEEEKNALKEELLAIEKAKNTIEGELLKHKMWIELDMGTHVKEMMESDPEIGEMLKYAFIQKILENPDPQKKEFYNKAYKEYQESMAGKTSSGSDLIFMMQMLLVECHEQMNTLQGFKLKDIVQYGKLDRFYDGILGGRTLRAMWNVAFTNYEKFPATDEANFNDPVFMKQFLNKVVSICGGVVSGEVKEKEEEKVLLSTTEITPISVTHIDNPDTKMDDIVASLFDDDIVGEEENADDTEEVQLTKSQKRGGRKANIIHQVGGTMDPINPETVWRMETTPALNLDNAKERAARFVQYFNEAGPGGIDKNFNKEEMMAKFFQIVKDYMSLTQKNDNGKVRGLTFRRKQLNIYRLTVLKEILKDEQVKDFMGKLDLQEATHAYSGGSVGLDKWKEYLAKDMGHEGGITDAVVDTMMNSFQKSGKL